MSHARVTRRVLAGLVVLTMATTSLRPAAGAVSLTLQDSMGNTSGTFGSGSTFTLTVLLSLTASTDKVTGLDYRVDSTLNGNYVNNAFSLLGRTTTPTSPDASGSNAGFISDPNNPDSMTAAVLNPSNGSGLGGTNLSGATLTGIHSNNSLATLQFKVNTNVANGSYVINFYLPGTDTEYFSAQGMNFVTSNFDSLGTYNVNVPEPATGISGLFAVSCLLRRRRQVSMR